MMRKINLALMIALVLSVGSAGYAQKGRGLGRGAGIGRGADIGRGEGRGRGVGRGERTENRGVDVDEERRISGTRGIGRVVSEQRRGGLEGQIASSGRSRRAFGRSHKINHTNNGGGRRRRVRRGWYR